MFAKKNKNQNVQQKTVDINQQEKANQQNEEIKKVNEEHSSFTNLEDSDLSKVEGILIYEHAKKRLNISNDGKIYRQKWFNYLPFVSIFTVLIYANYVFGKTKCLKDSDHALFNRAHFWVNMVGFLIMPIVTLALWTFGTWIVYDVLPGVSTNYSAIWTDYMNRINAASTHWFAAAEGIAGLFRIAIAPLVVPPQSIVISGTVVPTNIIFIATILVFTIINPENIIFTYIMNSKILRFITVTETSSIYRYRK